MSDLTQTPIVKIDSLAMIESIVALSRIKPVGKNWVVPTQAFHNSVFRAKDQYPELLRRFHFSPHTLNPTCVNFDGTFGSLTAAGLGNLSSNGNHYGFTTSEIIMIRERGRKIYRERVRKYPSIIQRQLAVIAAMFDEEVEKLKT